MRSQLCRTSEGDLFQLPAVLHRPESALNIWRGTVNGINKRRKIQDSNPVTETILVDTQEQVSVLPTAYHRHAKFLRAMILRHTGDNVTRA
jgi:hypothetical protein